MISSFYDVSFIIPAYNEEKNITRCFLSIVNAVEYNRSNTSGPVVRNYEIIIVDNASVDDTAEISKSLCVLYGHTYIYCKEKGITHARQAGYKVAKYKYQASIDADSWLPKQGWFDSFKEFEDWNVIAISGPVKYPESSWLFNKASYVFYFFGKMMTFVFGSMLQGGNFVVRKDALDKIGGHSTNISFYGEDTDLARRLSKYGKIKFIMSFKNYSSSRRYHEQGVINTLMTYSANFFWIHVFKRPFTDNYQDYR